MSTKKKIKIQNENRIQDNEHPTARKTIERKSIAILSAIVHGTTLHQNVAALASTRTTVRYHAIDKTMVLIKKTWHFSFTTNILTSQPQK